MSKSSGRLALCLALIGVFGCGRSTDEGPPPTRPNIVLISLDTLRADRLGCYGYARETSPRIDALAREGVVFERAIAQASSTWASHISLFQSRYAGATRDSKAQLPEVLQEAGYRTAAFVGGGYVSAQYGFDRGFDHFEEHLEGFDVSYPLAERWLSEQAARPFFLFLHTYDIHSPYDPGEPYQSMFADAYDGPVRKEQTSRYLRQMLDIAPPDAEFEAIEWNDADRRWISSLYDASIRKVDDVIGRLVARLDESPVWDWSRDVLVVLSDHGEEFFEHGALGHGVTLYQEIVHVPLILRAPLEGTRGRRVPETVMLMDLAPTLLELAGIETPRSFDGRSLGPLLRGHADAGGDRVAASQSDRHVETMIDRPWKLIRYGEEGRSELYDLERDPGETRPLQARLPEIARRMHEALSQQLEEGREIRPFVDADEIEDEGLEAELRALGYVE